MGQKGRITRAGTDKIHMTLLGARILILRKQVMQSLPGPLSPSSAIGAGAFGKIIAAPKISANAPQGQRLGQ